METLLGFLNGNPLLQMNLLLIRNFLLSTDIRDHSLQLLAELLPQIDWSVNRRSHRAFGSLEDRDRVLRLDGCQPTRVLNRSRNFQPQFLTNDLLTGHLIQNQAATVGRIPLELFAVEQAAIRWLFFGLRDLTTDWLDLQCRLRVEQFLGLIVCRIKLLKHMSDPLGIALLATSLRGESFGSEQFNPLVEFVPRGRQQFATGIRNQSAVFASLSEGRRNERSRCLVAEFTDRPLHPHRLSGKLSGSRQRSVIRELSLSQDERFTIGPQRQRLCGRECQFRSCDVESIGIKDGRCGRLRELPAGNASVT